MSEQLRGPVLTREWALFLFRWILPLGLSLLGFWRIQPDQDTGLALLIVVIISVISVLIMLVNITNANQNWRFVPVFIVLDSLLILTACYLLGEVMIWALVLPGIMAGAHYSSKTGGVVGLIVAAIGSLLAALNGLLHPASAILAFISAPAMGALLPLLTINLEDRLLLGRLGAELAESRALTDDVTRKSNAMLALVYEMAEILSASRLNPERVLNASLAISIEGLKHLDVEPPIYGAFLLFEKTDEGYFLKPAQISSGLQYSDLNIRVKGETGVLARAMSRLRPMSSRMPASDPEIGLFATFRVCKSLLCVPLLSGDDAYGVFVVGTTHDEAFQTIHAELLRALANQTAASLSNAQIYGVMLEQRDRMVEIESSTRARLASDLHDGPTQSISAIAMRLNYIRRLMEKQPEKAVEDLYAVEDLARRSATEIRHFLFEMRPKSLEDGLGRGLNQMGEKMKSTYGQEVDTDVAPEVEQYLDEQVKTTLFSIALESVTNARKHAEASNISVNAFLRDEDLVMVVRDNGKGFEVEGAVEASKRREGHLGLINLYERAGLIGGELRIVSAPGAGTTITVTVPLETLAKRIEESQRRQAEGGELVTHRVQR